MDSDYTGIHRDSSDDSDDDEIRENEFLARVALARRYRISVLETYSFCPPLNDGQNFNDELSGLRQMVSYNERYSIRPIQERRRIAGSKRVERYQLEHVHRKGSGKGQLLQSITAHPAISTRSFEVCIFFTSVDRAVFSLSKLLHFFKLGT
jgi:hypothetical protein